MDMKVASTASFRTKSELGGDHNMVLGDKKVGKTIEEMVSLF